MGVRLDCVAAPWPGSLQCASNTYHLMSRENADIVTPLIQVGVSAFTQKAPACCIEIRFRASMLASSFLIRLLDGIVIQTLCIADQIVYLEHPSNSPGANLVAEPWFNPTNISANVGEQIHS